jgi:sortase A
MRTTRGIWLRLLSVILIAFGAFLLGRGVREILESRAGQSLAARQFREEPRSPQALTLPKLGDTVAKLSIPRLGAELYVFEGTDTKDLRLGPGHMPGTAMPGSSGNCVIAGHRDTHFRLLKDIRQGDAIVLETRSGRFVYTVDDTSIVRPTNTSALQPTRSAVLHLITCYPFYYLGNAPKRFIVHAKLEEPLSASARKL